MRTGTAGVPEGAGMHGSISSEYESSIDTIGVQFKNQLFGRHNPAL
jgi:hypothetical protein